MGSYRVVIPINLNKANNPFIGDYLLMNCPCLFFLSICYCFCC